MKIGTNFNNFHHELFAARSLVGRGLHAFTVSLYRHLGTVLIGVLWAGSLVNEFEITALVRSPYHMLFGAQWRHLGN